MQTEITQEQMEQKRLYCNLNLKCDAYWNHDKCIMYQKTGKCQKQ